jgi:hypothetical protein
MSKKKASERNLDGFRDVIVVEELLDAGWEAGQQTRKHLTLLGESARDMISKNS